MAWHLFRSWHCSAYPYKLATLQAIFRPPQRSRYRAGVVNWDCLLTTSALQQEEDAEEVVFERIEQTPIQRLAPLVGVEVSQLLDQLAADGFTVETPEMSVEQLAETHATDTDDILLSIFQ